MDVIISTRGLTVSTTYKDALTRRLDKLGRPPPTRHRGAAAPAREAVAPAPEGELVVRRVAAKPMSVEEAVEQLELRRDQFLVFTNAGTDSVNVLYRRKSGGLGLIEPVP